MNTVEDFLKVKPTNLDVLEGRILIAVPFYNDPFFNRSVVLLTDYDDKNCVGLILNKKSTYRLQDLLPEIKIKESLYFGGLVVEKMIFAVHNFPSPNFSKLLPGIYTGFDDNLLKMVEENPNSEIDFKFFIGYSGWYPGQLQQEIEQNMWVVGNANPDLIFKTEPHKIWENAVINLGEEYLHWLQVPEYLSYN